MTILDARDRLSGQVLRPDICIVGAGPAGITLARELDGHGLEVLVLEGGGRDPDPELQQLNAGDTTGEPYYPLGSTRLRQLGGTSGHWEGYTRPLDEEDLTTPLIEPLGAWPFGIEELTEHYRTARELCEVDSDRDLRGETWAELADASLLDTDPEVLRTEILLMSPPTRFGERYRAELEAASDITVLLYANVVELVSSGDRVAQARIAHLDGTTQTVEAERFVLAGGGIEVPRLLLVSDDGSGVGIGNRNDLVGRHFMEHLHMRGLQLICEDAEALPFYTDEPEVDGQRIHTMMTVPAELRHALGIGNLAVSLLPSRPAARAFLEEDPLTGSVRSLLRDGAGRPSPDHLAVQLMTEQVPNARSRVTLSDRRDALGVPRCLLRWELDEVDRRTLRVGAELVAGQFAAVGLGRISSAVHGGSTPLAITGGRHHLGTTRMHEDPARGVVDVDGRVHGTDNLYVVSSSTFPTGGYANPTLTVVAMALRLAAHLRTGAPEGGAA